MSRLSTAVVLAATVGAIATTGIVATGEFATAATPAAVEAALPAESTTPDAARAGARSDAAAGRHQVRAWWKGLTEEQRQCLRDADLTRPVGRMSDAEREQLRADAEAAAQECGVDLPTRARADAAS
ncbi:MAG: hypothetical protein ACRCY8_10285 [Dermatophilaceae bacterium]